VDEQQKSQPKTREDDSTRRTDQRNKKEGKFKKRNAITTGGVSILGGRKAKGTKCCTRYGRLAERNSLILRTVGN